MSIQCLPVHVLEDDGCKLCCRNDAEDSECEVYTAQDIDLTQGTPCYKGFCSSSVRASLCLVDACVWSYSSRFSSFTFLSISVYVKR